MNMFFVSAILVLGLVHYSQAGCVSTCEEAKPTRDGELMLNVRGRVVSIFCHKLSSGKWAEYLTLKHSNTAKYGYTRVGTARNMVGTTTFNKIRVNLANLEVIRTDKTFSTTSGRKSQNYGEASGCDWLQKDGYFKIDLRGTPFKVSPTTGWKRVGYVPVGSWSASAGRQVYSGHCGGHCGACVPQGKLLLDFA